MTAAEEQLFDDLQIDHVRWYVEDLDAHADWLSRGLGLEDYSAVEPRRDSPPERAAVVGRAEIRFLLTQPLSDDHPGRAYLDRHGDTLADVALAVADVAAAFAAAVRRGAVPVAPPAPRHGGVLTATIAAVGGLTHTFVQRESRDPADRRPDRAGTGLERIDHFAIVTEPGRIDEAVAFYQDVLDFELIFVERLAVGSQSLITKVVQSRSRGVTFTLVEPEPAADFSHLEQFLEDHGGSGVQHVAFRTSDIIRSVDAIRGNGVAFLDAPGTYYDLLAQRLTPKRHEPGELRRREILIDEDHDGQLYQIFTRSVHPRGTVFFEVIERAGARSFGTGNIKALYSAVELEHEHEHEHDRDPR